MAEGDKVFTGSIPEIYDTHLVPLIFQPYADDLASRVHTLAPTSVLETAAGSGVVTRALAGKLSDQTRLTVTDLNQPMLDRARAMQPDDDRISWQQADALQLPFDDNQFDVVVCQFGVMFFPDRVAGLAEARRVLKDGGTLMFNAWDHISENEFPEEVTKALGEIFPDDPPVFLARTPHGYNDVDAIQKDVEAAGFQNITIDTLAATSAASSALDVATAFCHGTPLRNEIEQRDPAGLETATNAAFEAVAKRFGDGAVSGKIQAHVVTART